MSRLKPSRLFLSLTLICLVLAIPATVSAIDPDNLNSGAFGNRTGADIYYLYVSPGDSELWGTDILGSERVLDDGDTLEFFIHYPDQCNDFDIMAVDGFDVAYIVNDFEICDGSEASVSFTSDDALSTPPEFELMQLELTNNTGYEILYLFVSPEDSNMWGVDQMDSETTLDEGDTISLGLSFNATDIRYDVHAVDVDGDTYTFQVDLADHVDYELEAAIYLDHIDF